MIDPRVRALYYLYLFDEWYLTCGSDNTRERIQNDMETWEIILNIIGKDVKYNNEDIAQVITKELING